MIILQFLEELKLIHKIMKQKYQQVHSLVLLILNNLNHYLLLQIFNIMILKIHL